MLRLQGSWDEWQEDVGVEFLRSCVANAEDSETGQNDEGGETGS